MRIERSTTIAAPPEAVYEVIMDPARLGEWVTIHDGFRAEPPAELREGSRLAQSLRVAGQRFTVRWTVTEAHRPRRVVWTGEGPAGTSAVVAYELSRADGGTAFNYMNQYDLPGGPAGRLAGRAVSGRAAREAEETLRKLKLLLER